MTAQETAPCPACGVAVLKGWKFCPACGASSARSCARCGSELQPAWKACPHCGTSTEPTIVPAPPLIDAAQPPSAVTSGAPDTTDPQGWGVYDRASRRFLRPLRDLRRLVDRTARMADFVDAQSPAALERTCGEALSALAALGDEADLAGAVGDALKSLGAQRNASLVELKAATAELAAASPDARAVSLSLADLRKDSPGGPIAGGLTFAVLGSYVMPGVGTVVGGALGLLLGHLTKKDRTAADRYLKAAAAAWAALLGVFDTAWDRFVREADDRGFSGLRSAKFFKDAHAEWATCRAAFPRGFDAGCAGVVGERVREFLRAWGPLPAARLMLVTANLPPFPARPEPASAAAELALRLFPENAEAHRCAAECALFAGDAERTLELVERGLKLEPEDRALRTIRMEALHFSHALDGADAAFKELCGSAAPDCDSPVNRTVWAQRIRGLARGGLVARAADAVREWLARGITAAAAARVLRRLCGCDSWFAILRGGVPEFVKLPSGLEGEVKGIVETFLSADDKKLRYGDPPGDKKAIMRKELGIPDGEGVLWFYDWSFWQSAKTGAAITPRALRWKSAWADPVCVEFSPATADKLIHAAGSKTLTIDGKTLDLGDAALAAGVASVLTAVGEHLRFPIDSATP